MKADLWISIKQGHLLNREKDTNRALHISLQLIERTRKKPRKTELSKTQNRNLRTEWS